MPVCALRVKFVCSQIDFVINIYVSVCCPIVYIFIHVSVVQRGLNCVLYFSESFMYFYTKNKRINGFIFTKGDSLTVNQLVHRQKTAWSHPFLKTLTRSIKILLISNFDQISSSLIRFLQLRYKRSWTQKLFLISEMRQSLLLCFVLVVIHQTRSNYAFIFLFYSMCY